MVTLAAAAGAGYIATAGGGSGGDRRPSTIGRRDSKSCWSLDGSASMDSVMMVVPSDSPVTLCGLQDSSDGVQCAGCSGYYLDSNGHPVYGIDYVRYWDCCGASTESIESKVEQALELVKSHLMFAVREEMRALKDEFDELLRKNERLELENRLLRAHSSAEVLKQLGLELNKIQSSSSAAVAPPR